MNETPSLVLTEDHPLHRVQRIAIGVGAAALLVCALAGFANPTQLLRSYLVAYLFWVGGALGCLALLMIQHVTGGAWGVAIRRLLESRARTLPVMALLFVPIALGMRTLYERARPSPSSRSPSPCRTPPCVGRGPPSRTGSPPSTASSSWPATPSPHSRL